MMSPLKGIGQDETCRLFTSDIMRVYFLMNTNPKHYCTVDNLIIRVCMRYFNCGSSSYKGLYGILQLWIN